MVFMNLTEPAIARLEVIGLHPVSADRDETFDGFDLALTLSTGDVRVYGVRTAGLVYAGEPARSRGWLGGYIPVRIEFEPSEVRFWDFNEPMWIGPEPRPCLVWSNADGFTRLGIEHLVQAGNFGRIIPGRDGRGLPLLEDLALLR